MNLKEIKELIDALSEKDIAEFELERGNEKIRIKRATAMTGPPQIAFTPVTQAAVPIMTSAPAASPVTAAAATEPLAPPRAPEQELHIVKSPIVGTFYESPSPGSPAFVQTGDLVEAGQVLCIIEAMKLMNEMEQERAGITGKRFD